MASKKGLKAHEIANLFPEMNQCEYEALKNDIQARGQVEPILTHQGMILDGRQRYRACKELGMKPRVETWKGKGDPLAFVVSKNLQRRHLNSGQLAILAVEIEPRLAEQARERQRAAGGNRKAGGEKTPQARANGPKGRARDQAALLLGTNPRYVTDAKKLCKEDPKLAQKVKAGTISLHKAMEKLKAKAQKKAEASGKAGKGSSPGNGRGTPAVVKGTERRTGPNGHKAGGNGVSFGDVRDVLKEADKLLSQNAKTLDEMSPELKVKERERLKLLLGGIRDRANKMMMTLKVGKK